MQNIVRKSGYAPAVKVGNLLFCSGQIGRNEDMQIILDPREQFIACWRNLECILAEVGCSFDNIVEMTTYHVSMSQYMNIFREVKNQLFPKGHCAWTCIGVSELAYPGILVEIKVIALLP